MWASPAWEDNRCTVDDKRRTCTEAQRNTVDHRPPLKAVMALLKSQQDSVRESYTCSICLDQLREPVTIPCGHSYCLCCIKDYWNNESTRRFNSCPQCRHIFTLRPPLVKNTVLADLIEKTALVVAQPDDCYAGPGDVSCDICTGNKTKAIKSCVICLVSFCKDHVQSHYEVPGLMRHKLVEPNSDLQEGICQLHDEVMKMFCRRDRQGICYLCAIDEHKGHDMITAAAERLERQKHVSSHQRVTQATIQKVEEDLKILQGEVDFINQSTNVALTDIDEVFAEMIRPIESQRSDVKEKIRTKQKAEVGRLQDLQKILEQNIFVMKKNVDDLDQTSQIHSDIAFLQKCPQNLHFKKYAGLPPRDADPMRYLKNVTVALKVMKDKLKVFVKEEMPHISLAVAQVDILPSQQSEPKSRKDYLQYSCEMSFDPNTKTKHLSLSDNDRKITSLGSKKLKASGSRTVRKPKKAGTSKQKSVLDWAVEKCLSKESFTGRQYWEVEWTTRYVSIAVGYKDSPWNEQGFGHDDKSWALSICPTATEFQHNDIITLLPGTYPSRVGVYLDYRAGVLCFYNISDTMTLLRKVQTTFTQPLYIGIWLDAQTGATVEFCYPLEV